MADGVAALGAISIAASFVAGDLAGQPCGGRQCACGVQAARQTPSRNDAGSRSEEHCASTCDKAPSAALRSRQVRAPARSAAAPARTVPEPGVRFPPACACGQALERIGEEVSEQFDCVPAQFFVLRHIRGKYACAYCKTSAARWSQTISRAITSSKAREPLPAHCAWRTPGAACSKSTSSGALIAKLYEVEREVRELDPRARLLQSQSRAKPIAVHCKPGCWRSARHWPRPTPRPKRSTTA